MALSRAVELRETVQGEGPAIKRRACGAEDGRQGGSILAEPLGNEFTWPLPLGTAEDKPRYGGGEQRLA